MYNFAASFLAGMLQFRLSSVEAGKETLLDSVASIRRFEGHDQLFWSHDLVPAKVFSDSAHQSSEGSNGQSLTVNNSKQ